jgi:hypothetical protein
MLGDSAISQLWVAMTCFRLILNLIAVAWWCSTPISADDVNADRCFDNYDSTTLFPPYKNAADAHLLQRHGPPSTTRSRNGPNYALIAPDSRVFADPPRGWSDGATAATVVTPALGAHFSMHLVRAPAGCRTGLATVFSGSAPGLQRFYFLLTGSMEHISDTNGSNMASSQNQKVPSADQLDPGSFIYIGPGSDTTDYLIALEETTLIRAYSDRHCFRALSNSISATWARVDVF